MMKAVFLLGLALVASATLCSADFLDDVKRLADNPVAHVEFDDSHEGYDRHTDAFYYDDSKIDVAYDRSNYKNIKFTTAGQNPDLTGRKVPDAVRPFVVAQKSQFNFFTSSDRWDVKVDPTNGFQYLGLYRGENSDFTVNKLRAHLLRRLANALNAYLPILDRCAEPDAVVSYLESTEEEIRSVIQSTFRDVDTEIRAKLKANDYSSSSALVVIISKKYVISVNVGAGRLLAITSSDRVDLTPNKLELDNGDEKALANVFGNKKEKNANPVVATIAINPIDFEDEDGDPADIQMLLLETPAVAKLIGKDDALEEVVAQVNQHKNSRHQEQALYENSVKNVLEAVSKKLNVFSKLDKKNFDHTVILVGVTNDYTQIH